MSAHTNRLIHETSPYLRQHAHNPVDWYPWSEAAFEIARRDHKPILLSIGYSACHWCHVMAHESFEDIDIAAVMNAHFINIKVDREERPDLDSIYQHAVQFFIRRGGGWPLTMFLTPDQIPFYGGTYFPPTDRGGLVGFPHLLETLAASYQEHPEEVARIAEKVQRALSHELQSEPSNRTIAPDMLREAAEGLARLFDSVDGGFGSAPKFPHTPALDLLLRDHHQTRQHSLQNASLAMVTRTLDAMKAGGIYDHLGGGFHRYATDAQWLIPHFEKMLYDNAQMASIYFSAYQATGQEAYLHVGEETLDYVMREMTAPEGGFYATQDADTHGEEGIAYLWTLDEISEILGPQMGPPFCKYYGITKAGNFEGRNILHIPSFPSTTSFESAEMREERASLLRQGRALLLQHRMLRLQPFRDEKILTGWNGLMITAFVEGYQVTRHLRYLHAARAAADFIKHNLFRNDHLLHGWKDGAAKFDAYLDDHAFLGQALLSLYEVTGEIGFLTEAKACADALLARFWDDKDYGFFFTASDHEVLIAREKPLNDSSVPSGNAAAAHLLLRLFYLTGAGQYLQAAEQTLQWASLELDHAFGCGRLIAATDFYLRKPKEIILIEGQQMQATEALLQKIDRLYVPNRVMHRIPANRCNATDLPEPARGKQPLQGKPTVYLCHQQTCSLPMTDAGEICASLLA